MADSLLPKAASNQTRSFLGTGWGFPPTFDERTGKVVMASAEEDIKESIFIILSTTPGERTMSPHFGCDLQSMVFNSINSSVISQITDMIARALDEYEPRIIVENIFYDTSGYLDGLLRVHIEYTVRETNERTNIVYPFYLIEGTSIDELDI